MDTASDYRILMAEEAIRRLERRLRQWGMPWPFNRAKAMAELERARKSLLRVKYSYLPASDLLESEDLAGVVDAARSLASLVLPQQPVKLDGAKALAYAEIRWALSILLGLPGRIRLGEENHPEYAVDVVGVEVVRVEPLEGTDKLKFTRASAGNIAFTIVTNIPDIKVGEVRAAALLPPAEFSGVVSEAMYSSPPIEERYVGKRVPRKLLSSELRSVIIRLLENR